MPNAILRVGPYASSRPSLQFYSKETGIEQFKKSVNVSNTHWPDADWRSMFFASYLQVNSPDPDEYITVKEDYVGLSGASGSKEGLPTVFSVEWPNDGRGFDPFLGGGFFYQATEPFKLKLKYKFWNGSGQSISIRIVGEKIGTSSGSSPTQFLSHTIAPPNGGGSFPGPNIDDEYEIDLPASVLGQISISMDEQSVDAIAGTNWTLEFTTD